MLQLRPRVRLNDQCNIQLEEPEHIILGTYKNDFMTGGWADYTTVWIRPQSKIPDLIRAK